MDDDNKKNNNAEETDKKKTVDKECPGKITRIMLGTAPSPVERISKNVSKTNNSQKCNQQLNIAARSKNSFERSLGNKVNEQTAECNKKCLPKSDKVKQGQATPTTSRLHSESTEIHKKSSTTNGQKSYRKESILNTVQNNVSSRTPSTHTHPENTNAKCVSKKCTKREKNSSDIKAINGRPIIRADVTLRQTQMISPDKITKSSISSLKPNLQNAEETNKKVCKSKKCKSSLTEQEKKVDGLYIQPATKTLKATKVEIQNKESVSDKIEERRVHLQKENQIFRKDKKPICPNICETSKTIQVDETKLLTKKIKDIDVIDKKAKFKEKFEKHSQTNEQNILPKKCSKKDVKCNKSAQTNFSTIMTVTSSETSNKKFCLASAIIQASKTCKSKVCGQNVQTDITSKVYNARQPETVCRSKICAGKLAECKSKICSKSEEKLIEKEKPMLIQKPELKQKVKAPLQEIVMSESPKPKDVSKKMVEAKKIEKAAILDSTAKKKVQPIEKPALDYVEKKPEDQIKSELTTDISPETKLQPIPQKVLEKPKEKIETKIPISDVQKEQIIEADQAATPVPDVLKDKSKPVAAPTPVSDIKEEPILEVAKEEPISEAVKEEKLQPVLEEVKEEKVQPIAEVVKEEKVEPILEVVKEEKVEPMLEVVKEEKVEPILEEVKEEKVEPMLEEVKEEKVEPMLEVVKEEKVEPVKEEKVEPVKEEKVEPMLKVAKEEKVEPILEVMTEEKVEPGELKVTEKPKQRIEPQIESKPKEELKLLPDEQKPDIQPKKHEPDRKLEPAQKTSKAQEPIKKPVELVSDVQEVVETKQPSIPKIVKEKAETAKKSELPVEPVHEKETDIVKLAEPQQKMSKEQPKPQQETKIEDVQDKSETQDEPVLKPTTEEGPLTEQKFEGDTKSEEPPELADLQQEKEPDVQAEKEETPKKTQESKPIVKEEKLEKDTKPEIKKQEEEKVKPIVEKKQQLETKPDKDKLPKGKPDVRSIAPMEKKIEKEIKETPVVKPEQGEKMKEDLKIDSKKELTETPETEKEKSEIEEPESKSLEAVVRKTSETKPVVTQEIEKEPDVEQKEIVDDYAEPIAIQKFEVQPEIDDSKRTVEEIPSKITDDNLVDDMKIEKPVEIKTTEDKILKLEELKDEKKPTDDSKDIVSKPKSEKLESFMKPDLQEKEIPKETVPIEKDVTKTLEYDTKPEKETELKIAEDISTPKSETVCFCGIQRKVKCVGTQCRYRRKNKKGCRCKIRSGSAKCDCKKKTSIPDSKKCLCVKKSYLDLCKCNRNQMDNIYQLPISKVKKCPCTQKYKQQKPLSEVPTRLGCCQNLVCNFVQGTILSNQRVNEIEYEHRNLVKHEKADQNFEDVLRNFLEEVLKVKRNEENDFPEILLQLLSDLGYKEKNPELKVCPGRKAYHYRDIRKGCGCLLSYAKGSPLKKPNSKCQGRVNNNSGKSNSLTKYTEKRNLSVGRTCCASTCSSRKCTCYDLIKRKSDTKFT